MEALAELVELAVQLIGGVSKGGYGNDNSASANGGNGGDANGGEAQNCLAFKCRN